MIHRVLTAVASGLPLLLLALAPGALIAQNQSPPQAAPSSQSVPCCAFLGASGSFFPSQNGSIGGGINTDFTLQDSFRSRFAPDPYLRMSVNDIGRHPGGDFELGIIAPLALSALAKTNSGVFVYPIAVLGVHMGAPYRLYAASGAGLMFWTGKYAPFGEMRWRQPLGVQRGSLEFVLGLRIAVWD